MPSPLTITKFTEAIPRGQVHDAGSPGASLILFPWGGGLYPWSTLFTWAVGIIALPSLGALPSFMQSGASCEGNSPWKMENNKPSASHGPIPVHSPPLSHPLSLAAASSASSSWSFRSLFIYFLINLKLCVLTLSAPQVPGASLMSFHSPPHFPRSEPAITPTAPIANVRQVPTLRETRCQTVSMWTRGVSSQS